MLRDQSRAALMRTNRSLTRLPFSKYPRRTLSVRSRLKRAKVSRSWSQSIKAL